MDRYAELKKIAEEDAAAEMEQVAQARDVPETPYRDEFDAIAAQLRTMFLYKSSSEQYGTAFRTTGVLGAVVALSGDVARLQNLVLRNSGHGRHAADNVRDKFIDVAVQAIIGLMMLQESNWEGSQGKVKVIHDYQAK